MSMSESEKIDQLEARIDCMITLIIKICININRDAVIKSIEEMRQFVLGSIENPEAWNGINFLSDFNQYSPRNSVLVFLRNVCFTFRLSDLGSKILGDIDNGY